jgi:hypothetical protein
VGFGLYCSQYQKTGGQLNASFLLLPILAFKASFGAVPKEAFETAPTT